MDEIQLINFMQTNRQIFATYALVSTLLPIAVVFAAYIFRDLRMEARYAAMATSLISVVTLFVFVSGTQNVFFAQLTTLSQMAAGGSETAKNAMMSMNMPIGQTITAPTWLVGLSLVQIVLNIGLTVYLFAFAKWGDK